MGDWRTLFEWLVALVFCSAGLWMLFQGLARLLLPVREMRWVPVAGRITLSGVDENTDSDGTVYSLKLEYQYHYGGINYVNDRIAPLELWSSVRSTAESYARKYPRGRDVTVFVNPQNPGKSVLEPGRQVIAATCYVLLGVMLCGVVVLYALMG